MLGLFFLIFIILILAELVKGLSTNGTPPVLQKFSWQLDLAHFMWSYIWPIRIISAILLVILFILILPKNLFALIFGTIVFSAAWGFLFWLFNLFWTGKHKFKPLTNPTFVTAAENEVDLSLQVMGIEHNGIQKAYPVNMLFYHHQVPDTIGDLPIWVTYCGLCRSGRVYDISVDGQPLEFRLVGAITYNAVFRDKRTGSWWRQETGEAVKGPYKGKILGDVPMEQMSLETWLAKHPDSQILQYNPEFQPKYNFIAKLLNYEASLPGWHRQDTPSLIIGIEVEGQPKAYDWNELQKRRLVSDTIGNTDVLMLSSEDGTSSFAYQRNVNGETLDFTINGDELLDTKTQSKWNLFGKCTEGTMQGSQLTSIQSYQQFVRAWSSFHTNTTFYNYEYQA